MRTVTPALGLSVTIRLGTRGEGVTIPSAKGRCRGLRGQSARPLSDVGGSYASAASVRSHEARGVETRSTGAQDVSALCSPERGIRA